MSATLTPRQIIRRLYAAHRRAAFTFERAAFTRRGIPHMPMPRAVDALRAARDDYRRDPTKAERETRYENDGLCVWRAAVTPNSAPNERGERWIEAPTLRGLRLAGTAHGLKVVDHEGWFLDNDFQNETAHGVVYRLPARHGRTRYLAGMDDPYGNGGALIDCDVFESADWRRVRRAGKRRLWEEHQADQDAQRDAARHGDRIAERYAEREREYQDAFRAGQAAREKAEEAREAGRKWLALMRAARNAFTTRHARACIGIPLAETLAAFRTTKEALRDACDEYKEAREAAHSAMRDALDMHADAARDGYGA